MSDNDNRVRKMARMFEALAQAESDGSRLPAREDTTSGYATPEAEDGQVDAEDAPPLPSSKPPELDEAEVEETNRQQSAAMSDRLDNDDGDAIIPVIVDEIEPEPTSSPTESHVQRLRSTFEQLAQTSQASQLLLADGLQRQSMYLSMKNLYRSQEMRWDSSSNGSNDDNDDSDEDIDEKTDRIDGVERQDELNMLNDAGSFKPQDVVDYNNELIQYNIDYNGQTDQNNDYLTELEHDLEKPEANVSFIEHFSIAEPSVEPPPNPDPIYIVPRQFVSTVQSPQQSLMTQFYSDLETISSHGDRSVVSVNYSAFHYGHNDCVGLAEFYSDLEQITDSNGVNVDFSILRYSSEDPEVEPSNVQAINQSVEIVKPNIPVAVDEYSDVDDVSDFSDEDNESTDETADEATEATEEPVILSKVPHIIDEILTNEQNYIQTLSRGLHVYLSAFDDSFENAPLPVGLLGQKYHLFGNIERIRDFHANTFFPALQRCDPTDVGGICETFCRFCTEHSFYSYVLYAINSHRGDRLAHANREYFAQRQHEYGDRLGLNSFLLQPIQRLPRYQLLLRELIKELAKRLDVPGVKEQIASCCRAEKHLQRLLDQVNSSMTINDIVDNSEINVLHQGKFRFLHEFEVYECESRRRYRGKLFLFDKGVLVAEMLDKNTLQYRGFYTRNRLGADELDQNSFVLYDQRRNVRQVELATEVNAAGLWMQSLLEIVQSRQTKRRATVVDGLMQRDSGISGDTVSLGSQQQFVLVRNNGQTANVAMNSVSNAWSSGVSGMSDNSASSYDSDSKRTTWYTNVDSNLVRNGKTLERLLNSEKHFIQILTTYHRQFLANLPPNRYESLRKYTQTVHTLIRYHQDVLYPRLLDCDQDIVAIADAFRVALKCATYLEAYQVYAATCTKAYAQLDTIYATAGDASADPELFHYTGVPVDHLDRTHAFMDHLMCELKNADESFVSDEFKAVAVLAVQLNQFRTRVRDNMNLNAIKNNVTNFEEDYGLVEYGETCSVYGYKTRLLLLTKGLICVRTRQSTKTNREKFTDVEFQLPRSAVRTTESNRSKARLKFFASYAKEIEFKVDFPTEAIKLSMQKRIDVLGNLGW